VKKTYLYSVGFVVRAKKNELDCLIIPLFAVGTINNNMVSFFTANFTEEIDDNKIPFHRARVKSLPVSLQRLTSRDGILQDHVNLLFDSLFVSA